jgi:hypothetical protein
MKVQISLFFKAFFIALIVVFSSTKTTKAQTTLVAGDIVFTGVIARGASSATDAFSFVILKNVAQNTVIRFTDYGWRTTTTSFTAGGATGSTETEAIFTVTAAAGLPSGTEVKIENLSATLVGGGSAGSLTFSTGAVPDGSTFTSPFSLNGLNGDQIFAYQGTFSSPSFISGIHWNVYRTSNSDPTNTTDSDWDGVLTSGFITGSTSEKPTSLTAGSSSFWMKSITDVTDPEKGNGKFNCGPDISTAALVRAAVYDRANWTTNDNNEAVTMPFPIGFNLPTSCSFITTIAAPTFTTNPANSSICALTNTSFTVVATGATSYQWQVDPGSGFVNLTNDATYSNVTTATLNITNAPFSLNGYLYRCVATNGTGPTNSNAGTLTITPLPTNPTLLLKTPTTITVADGTPVSATFTAGSGGTGCTDDFRYTINGGATYLPYTAGSNISTTGLATSIGSVSIEGRRANCSSTCQSPYISLASWILSPLPAGATTLNAGDIAFSGYNSSTAADDFSFVLLRNIGPGTVINFTNNGWLSTNAFGTGEETITWTAPAGGLSAGTEIKIAGTTATKSGSGAAGTVTGTALSLGINGDQVLAYRGSAAAPIFISAIHMNVYSTTNSDPVTTTAAAWDGTQINQNASALPTGLTTGTNAIWIGTQGNINSEFDNAKYGNCSNPAVLGPISTLRASLNDPNNWTKNDGTGFTLPTGCSYLSILAPIVNVSTTSLSAFSGCNGTASAEQSFTVSGSNLTANIIITAPTGFEVSITSGSGFATSVTLTQSGGTVATTTIYARLTAAASGTPSGNVSVASSGVTTLNVAVSGSVASLPTAAIATPKNVCSTSVVLFANTPAVGTGVWSITSGSGGTITTPSSTTSNFTGVAGTSYGLRWTISNAGCPSSTSDVMVDLVANPTTAVAGSNQTVCGTSATLAANSPTVGLGAWGIISGSGGSVTSPTSPTSTFTGVVGNTYKLRWTITNTPCTASSSDVDITFTDNPTVSDAGSNQDICGTSATLAANTPTIGTGAWSIVSGIGGIITTPSSATSTFTGTLGTAYTLRWTISNAPCTASTDDVIVSFFGDPTTAMAGQDLTACINPGSATMAANAPLVGTGVWSQVVGGPATAIIFTTNSPTTNIGGLNAAGVYTFVWTISNGSCTPSRDTMTITVNSNPTPFTILGGGTFCPSTQTLVGPIDPNYTYLWQNSLTGIANPNSFTNFGGTSSSQDVTASGVYRLRATNQFGCSTTDTASIALADYVYNGSLAAGDAQQTGRMNRFGVVSTCAAPKSYPGDFITSGARFYDSYTITNPRNVPVCATIGLASGCGVNIFSAAYLGSFNPTSLSTNYLGDHGSSFPNQAFYEVNIPANGNIVIVVHEVNVGTGCTNYQLTVNLPRDLSPLTASPSTLTTTTSSTLTAPIANTYAWLPGGETAQSFIADPITATTTFYATLGYGNNGCTRVDSVLVTACTNNTWTGATSTDWFTASNWSCNAIPNVNTTVILSTGTPNACIIPSGSTQIKGLTINTGAVFSNNGTLTLNGGVVNNSGTYKGTGTLIGKLNNNSGGKVSPGL